MPLRVSAGLFAMSPTASRDETRPTRPYRGDSTCDEPRESNVTDDFQREDYVLRWPRELFRKRLSNLLDRRIDGTFRGDWDAVLDHLLSDAFESEQPAQDMRGVARTQFVADDPWSSTRVPVQAGREVFVRQLLKAIDGFPYELPRRPYRSQHHGAMDGDRGSISLATLTNRFVHLVADLEHRGYFERSFQKDCVDDPATVVPSELIESELGVPDLWPLSAARLGGDENLLLDVIEVVGEFVAAPQERYRHDFASCGWHHGNFNIALGRDIYFWQVNRLLAQSSFDLQLATSGEDRGRLVEASGDARNDLVDQAIAGAAPDTRDPIQHAIALFRKRGAMPEEKRSACIALAGVLERRRGLLRAELFRRDEGALFQIANEFDLRHRSASQHADYDPAFLDWIFWWYLGTIELTDRIRVRQQAAERA